MTQVPQVTGCAHFLDSSIQLPEKFDLASYYCLGCVAVRPGTKQMTQCPETRLLCVKLWRP